MGRPATDVYVGHIDGFAVIEGSAIDGVLIVDCPYCEDRHVGPRQDGDDLPFLKVECAVDVYVWLGDPDEFDPADHIKPNYKDGIPILDGYEERGKLRVECLCNSVHALGFLHECFREQRGGLIRQETDCRLGEFYVRVPANDNPPVVMGRIERDHQADQIVIEDCGLCGATHRHGRSEADPGDIVGRTPHCDRPAGKLPNQYYVRVVNDE